MNPSIAGLTGRILTAGNPGWEDARRNFCTRIDYDALTPLAVVFCQSEADVVTALRWTREHAVPFRVRSGRHNYEAYSVLANGLVIDVSELDEISIDNQRKIARVGAGVFALDLHERLYDVGVTLPAASGATVGIAGLALGGGFGVTSRKLALTCDNILNVRVLTATGEIINANANDNPDIFWACRGGGGNNFGIVTSFDFRVHPISFVGVCNITWSWDAFSTVVDAWQSWGPAASDNLSTFLRLGANRVITLFGQLTPDTPDELAKFPTMLTPVLDVAPPTGVTIQTMPYAAAAAMFAGVDPLRPQWLLHPHNDRQAFKSTSAIATSTFPQEAIGVLKSKIEMAPVQADWETNEPSMVQLLAGGGAPSRVAIDATAVPHRKAQFVVQYDAYWTDPTDAARSVEWIEGVRTAMLPYASGAYVNYADGQLDDHLGDYYGPNLDRLMKVKRAIDADNVFNFPQSIPIRKDAR